MTASRIGVRSGKRDRAGLSQAAHRARERVGENEMGRGAHAVMATSVQEAEDARGDEQRHAWSSHAARLYHHRASFSETLILQPALNDLGVLNFIPEHFVPRRHSIAKGSLTPEDRSYDQAQFERRGIPVNIDCLYEYYACKRCFYLQIEGHGFFYLKQDAALLGAPQFNVPLTLRLRAKTHNSFPIHNYSFFAVIQPEKKQMFVSKYDLEEKIGIFPPIRK
jgi:hypothetical protein